MKKLIFLFLLSAHLLTASAQTKMINIPALHQLVRQSETEYDRQNTAKNRQALVTTNEQANTTLLDRTKKVYRTLQQRYNTLGTLVSVAGIGLYGRPMVDRIISNQEQIVSMVHRNPALVAMGYESQLQFADQGKDLVTFLAGLCLSADNVNQMKASDRKVLFDHALAELSHLQDLSNKMLSLMQYSSLSSVLRSANPFQNYVDMDVAIGKEIIQNAKYLK
ncbi:hypothetical protein ABDD95_12550 [Mucilaginibacter sp. PAMB04274]|uniref:hypothetical protein n=1 Tax=Mucilaginibacter sp. PAMB04274 TaxID=3138568 RepID=UPI0031F70205